MTTPPTATTMLVAARRHRRVSQAELARRAGLPRSVVNTYERGVREPGADALVHVLRSIGLELVLRPQVVRPDPVRAARILDQVLGLAEALPSRRRSATIARAPFLELR